MATNMYLKLDGIEGESTAQKHEKEIEVLSWSHGFSQPTSPVRASSGGTVEKANHSDISITKYIDSATDDILSKCWAGNMITKATLSCYKSDGTKADNPLEYLQILMENVIISNYSIGGGGGDLPVENLSLSYGKVTYTYNPQKKADDKGAGVQPISHDLTTNEVG